MKKSVMNLLIVGSLLHLPLTAENKSLVDRLHSWLTSFFSKQHTGELCTDTKKQKRDLIIYHWMQQGVIFERPDIVLIDPDVIIEPGVQIGCGVHILRSSKIGKNCTIEAFSIIENSVLADNVTVHAHTIIKDSDVETSAEIGPFAHVHRKSVIAEGACIGNFVEVSASKIGEGTKAKHLAYLGMATLGKKINIGAGTITCNYNGVSKHPTTIQDGAFIGSNNTLIAPVTIGKGSFTAAGSTINENVPEGTLAIARARQVNKEGYVEKLKEKCRNEKEERPAPPTISDQEQH